MHVSSLSWVPVLLVCYWQCHKWHKCHKFLQWWHDVILPLWWSVTFTGFSNDLSAPLISCHCQWSCMNVTDDLLVPVMKICHFHWFQQWSVCITDKLSLSVVMHECNWWCGDGLSLLLVGLQSNIMYQPNRWCVSSSGDGLSLLLVGLQSNIMYQPNRWCVSSSGDGLSLLLVGLQSNCLSCVQAWR